MTAHGSLHHWHTEASKLPQPTMIGEWCISPGNVRFRVVGGCSDLAGRITWLAWELCTSAGVPVGVTYCERAL